MLFTDVSKSEMNYSHWSFLTRLTGISLPSDLAPKNDMLGYVITVYYYVDLPQMILLLLLHQCRYFPSQWLICSFVLLHVNCEYS